MQVKHVEPSSDGDQLFVHTTCADGQTGKTVSKVCCLLPPRDGHRLIGKKTITGWEEGRMIEAAGALGDNRNKVSLSEVFKDFERKISSVTTTHSTWGALPGIVTSMCITRDDTLWATVNGPKVYKHPR